MGRKKKEDNELSVVTQEQLERSKAIGQISEECYTFFGSYVNNFRAIANVVDGLKVSYKRLIWAAMQFPRGKNVPTANLVSSLSRWHPHNTSSCEDLNANLVKAGVFSGDGFFGYTQIDGIVNPHAATRYTKNRLSDLYWDILGDVIKDVPMIESPQGEDEPIHMPLPLPLCLRWDTKIRLTDGRDLTIKELSEEVEQGKENYVLSCTPDGDFRVSKVIEGKKTKTTGEYVRITLDNGEVINSTREHLFLMRDGNYKKAEELLPNDSLMPGYLSVDKDGRLMIKNNYSLNDVYIYRLSDKYNIEMGVYVPESGPSIHHRDHNKLNDNPDNLVRLTKEEHGKLHKDEFLKNIHSDEANRKRKITTKEYWSKEENHKLARERWERTGDIVNEKTGKTRRELARDVRIAYNKSEVGRQNTRKWWNTDAGKAARIKSQQALVKRNTSLEKKQKVKDYWNSPEGLMRKETLRNPKMNSDPNNTTRALRGKLLKKYKGYLTELGNENLALEKIMSEFNFNKWFKDKEDFLEALETYNHSVVSVDFINGDNEDFYDIMVDSKYHNFLLSSGIVVHNCLFMKTIVSGLGVGISCVYPNFSPSSLYAAYINNNPYLLEPNINILIDKDNSELMRLWETGKGRVIYSYKISRSISPDGKSEGILFEGDTGIFTPKINKFDKLVNDGKVYIEDLTDENGPKLFVGRIPGAKGITIEDIEAIARKACYDSTTYALNVTNGETCFRIPLKDWIKFTYENYINLMVQVNQRRIEKCKFNISVLEALPIITDYILNKNPKADDKEIKRVLGYGEDIISVVMSKPISYLRKNKDTADRIKKLKDELKELKKFDPVKYTEEIISKL